MTAKRLISILVLAFAAALAGCRTAGSEAPAKTAPGVEARAPDATPNGKLLLPLKEGSIRFAVIGDTGTGATEQYEIAKALVSWRERFPFTFVLMMGDNMYGADTPRDYQRKFEEPYKALLAANVKFYAALGNHDDPNQRNYKNFNMGGERFYTFKPEAVKTDVAKAEAAKAEAGKAMAGKTEAVKAEATGGVRFFALDSNYLSPEQLAWLEKELGASGSEWKICFFHHPMYSSGMAHGPSIEVREALEPLFVKHGVDMVFTGHEHFYERIKPQKGITYIIAGASAKLRRSNVRKSDITDKAFDQDNSFMLVEIAGDEMHFQTIARSGETVDAGVLTRANNPKPAAGKD